MAERVRRRTAKRTSLRKRRKMRFLFGVVIVCVTVVTVLAYVTLYRYVSRAPEDKICNNIYIGPVNVSGLTEKEAAKKMKKHMEADQGIKVTMRVGEKYADATLEELGASSPEMDKIIKKAVNYGKKGRLYSRYRQIKKLQEENLVLGEAYVLDSEKAKAVLTERVLELADHAKNASVTKVGSDFIIEDEEEGKTIDIVASTAKIRDYLNGKWEHEDFSIKMVQKKEKPSVKAEDLKSIQDELGAFSTDAGGGQRWQNLKTGVDNIDKTVLMPGEEFSVHDSTAPYDAEHGYVEAGSYENGQVVDSFGGGICQVSTTLYNAVLYAELEVLERYPHSMLVAYVDPSRDAAIAGDYLDFRFKNSYDTPVYIEAVIDSTNQMRFTIYGKDTREKGRTVEFESETLTTEDYGVKYKENPEASLGSVQYSGSPHTGKTAQLWKVVYKDGAEVSRDVINNSTYEKSDQIIEIGTASDNAQASAAVRSAIGTQDKEKINAAIAQAQGMQTQSAGQQETQSQNNQEENSQG